MAHRTFRDEHGREWEAWEVVPTAVERRMAQAAAAPRPAGSERRKTRTVRLIVPKDLQRGWLAFQSGLERRRLVPIPPDWQEMTNEQLVELLGRAARRGKARRLIE